MSLTEDSLVEQLSHVEAGEWHLVPLQEDAVSWLPLVPISESGLWLGLSKGGDWMLGRLHNEVIPSVAGSLPQPWLTILDTKEEEFRGQLAAASARYQLPVAALQDMVPVDDILALALRSGSRHWAECGVRWLTARSPREDHLEILRGLVHAPWASQWTRQSARRIVSRFS